MRFRSDKGSTAIEIIMTVVIGGLALSSAVYGLRNAFNRQEIDGIVRSLVYDTSAAQQAAFTRRATVTASFQNQTYSISISGGPTLRQKTLSADITLGPTLQTVTFNRRGVPSAPLTLTVSSLSTGRAYTVTVAAGTGRVSFSEP